MSESTSRDVTVKQTTPLYVALLSTSRFTRVAVADDAGNGDDSTAADGDDADAEDAVDDDGDM